MRIKCHHCSTIQKGIEQGKYCKPDPEFRAPPDWERFYVLYMCTNYYEPILVSKFQAGYDESSNPIISSTSLLYPTSSYSINQNIPESLRKALLEAINTYEAEVHTAAAIMCRRTLDRFCAENGATKRSLAANLEELRDKGVITDQLFEWATALRLSGNEAAHDVTVTFSAEDARDLLDFTVAILDFTYSFRVKFEAFRARRGGDGAS
jgi:hypothetical protein